MKVKKLKVEVWDIARIKPYGKNAKIHTEAQVEKIAKSIDRFGFRGSLGVKSDGELVTGHGRLMALQKLGFTEVRVEILEDMTEHEIAAYRLADNQTAQGKFDYELMKEDMLDFDTTLLDGIFESKELKMLSQDFFVMDEAALHDSLNEAVDAQRDAQDELIASAKGKGVSVATVMGFKSIPLAESKSVTHFMAEIQSRYGDDQQKAFVEFTKHYLLGAS